VAARLLQRPGVRAWVATDPVRLRRPGL